MLVIAGYLVVLASVFGGFALSGGHLAALLQPVELLMIGGAGAGALFVGNTGKALHAIVRTLPSVLKGSSYAKAVFMELMALLYDILVKVRKEGLMTIEDDVENPAQSPLFAHYPLVLADSHMLEFVTDYLRLMVGGNLNAFEIENLMDNEIETHHPGACSCRRQAVRTPSWRDWSRRSLRRTIMNSRRACSPIGAFRRRSSNLPIITRIQTPAAIPPDPARTCSCGR